MFSLFNNRLLKIKDKEINKKLNYNLPCEKQEIIKKIDGVYALIGPDVNIKNISTLFNLFIGNGIVQAVFFNKGELIYVKHYVRTEKLLYEEKNGVLPSGIMHLLFLSFLNKLHIFPNPLGVANTALLNIKNKIYALYERDTPYLLNIDFVSKTIDTIKKIEIKSMAYFSAHSKYDENDNTIHSIEYNVIENNVKYKQLNSDSMSLKMNKVIHFQYIPIIHDFIKINNKIIITESPIVFCGNNIIKKKSPILLDNSRKTSIHVLDTTTMITEKYYTKEGFYIFHYADCIEKDETIEIYASLYNELDFSDLNINGKYRKIIINKNSKNVDIIRNDQLENLNLEFPIKFEDKIVFRNTKNSKTNGFIICKELEIIKEINFEERFILGEPSISYIEGTPYLFAFTFDYKNSVQNSFLVIINMYNYEEIEIPIDEKLNIGFHSIFIDQ